MEHYYSKKQTSDDAEIIIRAVYEDREFRFITSSGVFSKKFVDFGSSLLIKTFLDDFTEKGSRILDIGCGYGPIGITIASKYPDATVDMADINERALELADRNIKENRATNARTIKSDSFASIEGSYDAIVTNPPIRAGKKVVYGFFEGAHERLVPGGLFYCVIQKKQGAESAAGKLKELFGNCRLIASKSGYKILKSTKL